jgi:undecaprenyl-phosphate 4-deoxy-4-formamido-L-arabinose transferase
MPVTDRDRKEAVSRTPAAIRAANPHVSIVVPVYGSQDCLDPLVSAITQAMQSLGYRHEIILVNDASKDGSWDVICALSDRYRTVVGVDLRRNFGQDNAILSGLRIASGDYIAVMDDDLQHDPRYLRVLLAKAAAGADVVYARFAHKRQSLWKNMGSWLNGKVAEWVLNKPKGLYLSPYKVIRREVAELISSFSGGQPYVDGLLLQVTSHMEEVEVEHLPRYAGKSNYTLWKSLRVWGRLAFSFSVLPLRLVTMLGFTFSAIGLLMVVVVVAYRLLYPQDFGYGALGWASLMTVILLLGGIQMIFFGVIGEYVGRTYLRVNEQPQAAVRLIVRGASPDEGTEPDETLAPEMIEITNQLQPEARLPNEERTACKA